MLTIVGLAIDVAKSLPRDLPGFLWTHVADWQIVDSTTVFLDKTAWMEDQPREATQVEGRIAAVIAN